MLVGGSLNAKLTALKDRAVARGLGEQWILIGGPWLEQTNISIAKVVHTSGPSAVPNTGCETAGLPSGAYSSDAVLQELSSTSESKEKTDLKDLSVPPSGEKSVAKC